MSLYISLCNKHVFEACLGPLLIIFTLLIVFETTFPSGIASSLLLKLTCFLALCYFKSYSSLKSKTEPDPELAGVLVGLVDADP